MPEKAAFQPVFWLNWLKHPLIVAIAAAATGAVISIIMNQVDPAWVNFYCPNPVVVGKPVRCTNLSVNVSEFRWNFGNGETSAAFEGETSYNTAGSYMVELAGFPPSRPEAITRSQAIEVSAAAPPDRDLAEGPLRLKLVGVVEERQLVRNQEFPVNRIKNDHPNVFRVDTQSYTIRREASDGFRIIAANFEAQSASNAEYDEPEVVEDGKAVRFDYRLTSGPATDRWRGWLYGVLRVREVKEDAASQVGVAEQLTIDRTGAFVLPTNLDLASFASILVIDAVSGELLGRGAPSDAISLSGRPYTIGLEKEGGSVILTVRFAGG